MNLKNVLLELVKEIKSCKKCRLHLTRKNAVPGEGNHISNIMIIAQAPGRLEDEEGQILIGPSGRVFDQLLDSIQLSRNEIYLTNLVKCFLPNCRKPRQDEINTCDYFLSQEIEYINPKYIITLGFHTTRNMIKRLGFDMPDKHQIADLFGNLLYLKNKKILPLRHPATVVHKTVEFNALLSNYNKIKDLIKPCEYTNRCPIKVYHSQGLIPPELIEKYCYGLWSNCHRHKIYISNESPDNSLMPDGKNYSL